MVASVLLFGCEKVVSPPVKAEDTVFQKPSATEIFNLRSRCAALGEKIMNENVIGSALTQSQTSHYSPKTNRCYVELDVNMADLNRYNEYAARYLYDGQTGEMLAWCKKEKGDSMTGFIFGGKIEQNTYLDASMKIDAEMADDRKQ